MSRVMSGVVFSSNCLHQCLSVKLFKLSFFNKSFYLKFWVRVFVCMVVAVFLFRSLTLFDNHMWCRDFDEGLLQRISDVAYEDDIKEIPSAPDVSNYLISEVRRKSFYRFLCSIHYYLIPNDMYIWVNLVVVYDYIWSKHISLFLAQDDTTTSNGNKDSLGFDGMSDTEVEKRLKVCWCSSFSLLILITGILISLSIYSSILSPFSSFWKQITVL